MLLELIYLNDVLNNWDINFLLCLWGTYKDIIGLALSGASYNSYDSEKLKCACDMYDSVHQRSDSFFELSLSSSFYLMLYVA